MNIVVRWLAAVAEYTVFEEVVIKNHRRDEIVVNDFTSALVLL